MNWSGNFREGLAREIRENKTLAKITAYTVYIGFKLHFLISGSVQILNSDLHDVYGVLMEAVSSLL